MGNMKERAHLEELDDVNGKIIDFKLERMAWNGFVCLTIWTSCGCL
jgi:hypothetical protein